MSSSSFNQLKKRRLDDVAEELQFDRESLSKRAHNECSSSSDEDEEPETQVQQPGRSNIGLKLLQKAGYREGQGLGRDGTGIAEPVVAQGQLGRGGLGFELQTKTQVIEAWNSVEEDKFIEEVPLFLECSQDTREAIILKSSWIKEGRPKFEIDDETQFCDGELIADMLQSKSCFDTLTENELHYAKLRANPYETISKAIFQNRAAVKMANMDKVFGWALTREFDDVRRQSKATGDESSNTESRKEDLFYFVDVCAGPGGFSEYVLWRKGFYNAHGMGFTLKGDNDFKLEQFKASSGLYFDPYYGPTNDGNIYDPKNLQALEDYVQRVTGGLGAQLVMGDGGFSVRGKENIQEILSKRLYLCQFIVGLSCNRVSTDSESAESTFVCKLFDIFTPFSAGLVYLMHVAYRRVSLHKPITSRPANSERYIICSGLTEFGATKVKQHLLAVNRVLEKYSVGVPDTEKWTGDVVEVVPVEVMKRDRQFMEYLVSHNESAIQRQTLYLRKYAHFAKNRQQRDLDQSELRKQAMAYWELPAIERSFLAVDDTKPLSLIFRNLASQSYLQRPVFEAPKKVSRLDAFHIKLPREVFPELYYAQIACSPQPPFMLISDNVERVYIRTVEESHFRPADELPPLPAKTLLLVERCKTFVDGRLDAEVLRIIDAAWLGGDNVSRASFEERKDAAEKFVHAVTVRAKDKKVSSDKLPKFVVAPFAHVKPIDLEPFLDNLNAVHGHNLPIYQPSKTSTQAFKAHGIRISRAFPVNVCPLWSMSQQTTKYFDYDRARAMNEEALGWLEFPAYATFWNVFQQAQLIEWKESHHLRVSPEQFISGHDLPGNVISAAMFAEQVHDSTMQFCNNNNIPTEGYI